MSWTGDRERGNFGGAELLRQAQNDMPMPNLGDKRLAQAGDPRAPPGTRGHNEGTEQWGGVSGRHKGLEGASGETMGTTINPFYTPVKVCLDTKAIAGVKLPSRMPVEKGEMIFMRLPTYENNSVELGDDILGYWTPKALNVAMAQCFKYIMNLRKTHARGDWEGALTEEEIACTPMPLNSVKDFLREFTPYAPFETTGSFSGNDERLISGTYAGDDYDGQIFSCQFHGRYDGMLNVFAYNGQVPSGTCGLLVGKPDQHVARHLPLSRQGAKTGLRPLSVSPYSSEEAILPYHMSGRSEYANLIATALDKFETGSGDSDDPLYKTLPCLTITDIIFLTAKTKRERAPISFIRGQQEAPFPLEEEGYKDRGFSEIESFFPIDGDQRFLKHREYRRTFQACSWVGVGRVMRNHNPLIPVNSETGKNILNTPSGSFRESMLDVLIDRYDC